MFVQLHCRIVFMCGDLKLTSHCLSGSNAVRWGPYVRWANFFATNIKDEDLTAFVAHCGRGLETLVLAYCRNITDVGIAALAEHCGPTLRHLILWGMSSKLISDTAVRFPSPTLPVAWCCNPAPL